MLSRCAALVLLVACATEPIEAQEEDRLTVLAAEPSLGANERPGSWGENSAGLVLALTAPAQVAAEAKRIPVCLHVKNATARDLCVTLPLDLREAGWHWRLEINGPNGPVKWKGALIVYPQMLQCIPAGGIMVFSGVLQPPVWDLSVPGKYGLQVVYHEHGARPGDPRPIWGGRVTSNRVEVELR